MTQKYWSSLVVMATFLAACEGQDDGDTGAIGSGGSVASGGAQASGGVLGTGGGAPQTTTSLVTSGGTTATAAGGATTVEPAAGGATSTQGTSATGGTNVTGGSSAKGGTSATGGTSSKGGTSAVGGTSAKGGTSSKGGTSATGGGSAAGGSSATGNCSLYLSGATGSEANGQIPVCCTPTTTETPYVTEVFTQLNDYRVSQGLSALAYDTGLELAIQGHCVHMAAHTFFEHTAPETAVSGPSQRLALCAPNVQLRGWGENIAKGQATPTAVMTSWKNSAGHNANMLGDYTKVGVGYRASGSYWGQVFGK